MITDELFTADLKRKEREKAVKLLEETDCLTEEQKDFIYDNLETQTCINMKTNKTLICSGIGRKELAELCGVDKKNVDSWSKNGKIKDYYDSFQYIIPVNEVIRVLESRK